MSTPHILSLCHLQEHSLNFLGKYKYVLVVFSTSFTSLLVFLHLLQSIIHPPACSIHLDFLSIHTVGSYSLAYDASATLKFFGTSPSAKCLFFFSKAFSWFSIWLVLSCIMFFLHQLEKKTYADLLLLLFLCNPWKTVLEITLLFKIWNPSSQETGLISW